MTKPTKEDIEEFNNQIMKLKVVPCLGCVCYQCDGKNTFNRCQICQSNNYKNIKRLCIGLGRKCLK